MKTALLLLATAACATSAMAQQDSSIRIGGSTTSLPIISACAAHFMEKYPTWDKADGAAPKEPTVVYVTGGGSGFGVRGIQNGTIDIGLVARDLRDSEVKAIGEPMQKVFARDAVAIATSAKNPLAGARPGFSAAELASIFSGEVKNFSQIDGSLPARPIVLVTRDASGGVTEIFQDRVMKQAKLASSRLQFPSTAALIKRIETNDSAVAFVSAGAVSQDSDVRTYAVDGVTPTAENIVTGRYTLSRPLLVVTRANAPVKVRAFVDYVLGPDCQQVVREQGFVAVAPGAVAASGSATK